MYKMTGDIREMLQKRAKLIDEAHTILDKAQVESRSLTAEESRKFDTLQRQAELATMEIQQAGGPSSDELSSSEERGDFGRIAGGRGDVYGSRTEQSADPREIRALRPNEQIAQTVRERRAAGVEDGELFFGRWLRGVITGNWTGAEAEQRAMSGSQDTAGGYLMPEPLSAQIIDLARNQARVIQAGALTVPMESSSLTLARVDGDPTAYWKAEGAEGTESDMTFGAYVLRSRTLMALCRVSVELAEDAYNLGSLVQSSMSSALALELDRAALRGMGAAEEPMGILNTDGVTVTSMGPDGAALTTLEPFSQAVQDIAEANGEATSVILSPREWGTIDRMLDGDGKPLTPLPSWAALRKYVTNQIPINLAHGMATTASEAYIGDFTKCLIGMRTQLTLEVSREAGTAFHNLQMLIRAYLRADVCLTQPGHFVVLTGIIPA